MFVPDDIAMVTLKLDMGSSVSAYVNVLARDWKQNIHAWAYEVISHVFPGTLLVYEKDLKHVPYPRGSKVNITSVKRGACSTGIVEKVHLCVDKNDVEYDVRFEGPVRVSKDKLSTLT